MWISITLIALIGVTLTDDQRRRIARLLRDALERANGSWQASAYEAQRDARQLAREVDGEQGAIRALMMQPPSFWQWLWVLLSVEFGEPAEVTQAVRAGRMAKMGYRRTA